MGAAAFAALPAWAQEATDEAAEAVAEVVEEVVPVMDKGDVSWMMVSTVLVLFMTIPGLALFYGGLVRSKNMLSVLMQTTDDRLRHDDRLGDLRLFVHLRRIDQPLLGRHGQAVPVGRDCRQHGCDLLAPAM